jgi:hypothetical protein
VCPLRNPTIVHRISSERCKPICKLRCYNSTVSTLSTRL